ncbi:ankyrin, partial [Trematosphaeria pertusa]
TKEQQRRSIVEWLGPPYPTSACNDAQRLRSAKTGDWFLNNKCFAQWKATPRSMLWLCGIPGSGKTVLCSSIIEDLGGWCRLEDGRLLLYFFFDFAARDTSVIGILLRSLLAQIVIQRRAVPDSIQALFEQHHGGFQQPNIRTLLGTLQKTLEHAEQTYLVIDALDECAERADLLETLEDMQEWRLDNFHILATSRREKDIEESFLRMGSEQLQLEGARVNDDIRQYVSRRMQKERWLKKWPDTIQANITSVITTRAGDMFRLATLQLDGLKRCRTLKSLQATLSSLPATLDETYSRILGSIEPEQARDAMKILSWLCFAFRPPTVEELVEALAVDLETLEYDATQRLQDPEDILAICGSLVTRASDTSGVLKLSHYSVKEYLISKRILDSNERSFYMTVSTADVYLAKTCLVYLRSRPYRSRNEATATSDIDHLVKYAADFWSEHFKRCREDSTVLSLARELFVGQRSHFLDWAWLASIVPDGFYTESPKKSGPSVLLYYSALIGSPDLIDAMLNHGADINAEGGVYGTALTVAVYSGSLSSVELLLSRGSDVNVQSGYFGNALQAAVSRERVDIVNLLLAHGANVNACGGRSYTALYAGMQCRNKREELVKILIAAGADASLGQLGCLPLCSAARQGAYTIARLLIESGADPNKGGCLQQALLGGHAELADLLLRSGAKLSIRNSVLGSPIGAAAWGISMLRFLVGKWKADYLWTDHEGRTALHFAANVGTLEALEYLLNLGMDINTKDAKGWTAIHYAAEASTTERLKMLLSKWQRRPS